MTMCRSHTDVDCLHSRGHDMNLYVLFSSSSEHVHKNYIHVIVRGFSLMSKFIGIESV